jgi:hypothetical protein
VLHSRDESEGTVATVGDRCEYCEIISSRTVCGLRKSDESVPSLTATGCVSVVRLTYDRFHVWNRRREERVVLIRPVQGCLSSRSICSGVSESGIAILVGSIISSTPSTGGLPSL